MKIIPSTHSPASASVVPQPFTFTRCSSPASVDAGLVVRMHDPTPAMVQRSVTFARSCSHVHPPMGFAVSVHCSSSAVPPYVQQLRDNRVCVHTYTTAELYATFPSLHQLEAITWNHSRRRLNPAWFSHVEPLLLFAAGSWRFQHLWVMEQDVATNDDARIASIMHSYRGDRRALLMPIGFRTVSSFGGASWHLRVGTNQFFAAHPPQRRLFAFEFVQRLSQRLMHALHAAALSGQHGWSEMVVPTVTAAAGLKSNTIRAAHRGSIFGFCCTASMLRETWDRFPNAEALANDTRRPAPPRWRRFGRRTVQWEDLDGCKAEGAPGSRRDNICAANRFYHPIKF